MRTGFKEQDIAPYSNVKQPMIYKAQRRCTLLQSTDTLLN